MALVSLLIVSLEYQMFCSAYWAWLNLPLNLTFKLFKILPRAWERWNFKVPHTFVCMSEGGKIQSCPDTKFRRNQAGYQFSQVFFSKKFEKVTIQKRFFFFLVDQRTGPKSTGNNLQTNIWGNLKSQWASSSAGKTLKCCYSKIICLVTKVF